MPKTNNNSFWSVLAILLVIVAFFINYYIQIPGYKAVRNESSTVSAELTAATKKKDSLDQAKTDIDSLGDYLQQMFVAIPGDKDTANVIAELEAIATKNGTTIPSIQISDSSAYALKSGTSTLSKSNAVLIAFSVNGTFESLSTFTKNLENDLKFFNIKALTLSSSNGTMSMSVQIEAYKQKDPALSVNIPTASTTLPTTAGGTP